MENKTADKILIRKAGLKDLNDILRLNYDLFKKEQKEYDKTLNVNWPYNEGKEYFKDRISKKTNCFVVLAAAGGKKIGYLCGSIKKPRPAHKKAKYAEIENMIVDQRFRDRGVGTELVKSFTNWCKLKKVDYILVSAFIKNNFGINFYKKVGFKEYMLKLRAKI